MLSMNSMEPDQLFYVSTESHLLLVIRESIVFNGNSLKTLLLQILDYTYSKR